jgi:exo-beta-1,3-glucanase (GH17 family)
LVSSTSSPISYRHYSYYVLIHIFDDAFLYCNRCPCGIFAFHICVLEGLQHRVCRIRDNLLVLSLTNNSANNADGSCKTTAQWTTAFNKLKGLPQHITSVRLYASSDCNTLANAVPAALNTGTKILVGVWAEDVNHFEAEKKALLNAISAHGKDWIIAITVGSEDLYRKDSNPNTLANRIYDVRGMVRSVGVQAEVGHVDTWTAWVDGANEVVIKASDFIGMDG